MGRETIAREAAQDALGYRPLYRRVRDVLVKRILRGPLARRRRHPERARARGRSRRLAGHRAQGARTPWRRSGSWCAARVAAPTSRRHDDARILFQFFKLVPDDGPARFPDSRFLEVGAGRADATEAARLGLARGARVTRLERLRALDGEVCVHERIVVAKARFPDLDKRELPNNLYELYANIYGVPVARGLRASEGDRRPRRHRPGARRRGGRAAPPGRSRRLRHRRRAGGMAAVAVPDGEGALRGGFALKRARAAGPSGPRRPRVPSDPPAPGKLAPGIPQSR